MEFESRQSISTYAAFPIVGLPGFQLLPRLTGWLHLELGIMWQGMLNRWVDSIIAQKHLSGMCEAQSRGIFHGKWDINWLMAKQRREMLSNYIGLSLVFDIPFELEFSGKWKVLIWDVDFNQESFRKSQFKIISIWSNWKSTQLLQLWEY